MVQASENNTAKSVDQLDVIGIGITVEMFQGTDIWKRIKKSANASILPPSSTSYLSDRKDKENARQIRSEVAFAAATKEFVGNWPIPSLTVWPIRRESDVANDGPITNSDSFAKHIEILRDAAKLTHIQISQFSPHFNDEPEQLLERIFQLFNSCPDLPALLVFATDGDLVRELVGDYNREIHCCDGPRRFDAMSESNVAILFARRDRVDSHIRPFVGTRETHIFASGPTKDGFKPSRFIPQCWSAQQLDCFDRLPTIATIHRPVTVSYVKESDGQIVRDYKDQPRLHPEPQRESIFKAALDKVLKDRPAKPDRIFFDAGGPRTGDHVTPLSLSVTESFPDFDLFHPDEGIDISQRLGNTGAVSPFVMWALAALVCKDESETCLTVNLRRREAATITAVTRVSRPKESQQQMQGLNKSPVAMDNLQSTRIVPIGTKLASGDECNQTGLWRCDPPDATAGDKHFLISGRRLPPVRKIRNLTTLQKLRGESGYDTVPATYTLVSYDSPSA